MDLPVAEPRECVVLFQPESSHGVVPWWFKLWRRWFMRPGYGHVAVAWWDTKAAVWIVVDPKYGAIEVAALSHRYSLADVLRMWPHTEALHVRAGDWQPRPRGLVTCVSIAKAVLGLGGWAVTPWQLRNQLMEHRA